MAIGTNVDGVSNNFNDFLYTKKVREGKNELDRDDFLKIIMTQLQNQDPTAPLDDANFLNQVAQLTNIQNMNAMAASFAQTQSYGMIGKGVTGFVRGVDGYRSEVIGTVDSAGVEAGKSYVMVKTHKIWVEDITQVFDNRIISGNIQDILTGSSLVGKYVRSDVKDEEGNTVSIVGQVQRVEMDEGEMLLLVDGVRVALFQVTAVAESREQLEA